MMMMMMMMIQGTHRHPHNLVEKGGATTKWISTRDTRYPRLMMLHPSLAAWNAMAAELRPTSDRILHLAHHYLHLRNDGLPHPRPPHAILAAQEINNFQGPLCKAGTKDTRADGKGKQKDPRTHPGNFLKNVSDNFSRNIFIELFPPNPSIILPHPSPPAMYDTYVSYTHTPGGNGPRMGRFRHLGPSHAPPH